jgi:hypothetical protein
VISWEYGVRPGEVHTATVQSITPTDIYGKEYYNVVATTERGFAHEICLEHGSTIAVPKRAAVTVSTNTAINKTVAELAAAA